MCGGVEGSWGSVNNRPDDHWGVVDGHWGVVDGHWGMVDHWADSMVDGGVDESRSDNGGSMDQGVVGAVGLLNAVGNDGSVTDDALVAGLVGGGNSQEGRNSNKGLKY